MKPVIRRESVA